MFSFSNSETIKTTRTDTEKIEDEIYSAFNEIKEIESIIKNNNIGFNDSAIFKESLVKNVQPIAMNNEKGYYRHPNQLNSFLYGCLFGPIGVLIVWSESNKNKALVNQSIKGCITNAGLVALSNVAFYALLIVSINSGPDVR